MSSDAKWSRCPSRLFATALLIMTKRLFSSRRGVRENGRSVNKEHMVSMVKLADDSKVFNLKSKP